MAHFARLDENNKVLTVIVIHNNELLDENGIESEEKGINTVWKQTSYNGAFRKNYAGVDFVYDSNLDAFIPPKPYPSWILNEETAQWEAPIPMPNDGQMYYWNEETSNWQINLINNKQIIDIGNINVVCR